MTTSDFKELLDTVQRVRAATHPETTAAFVEAVVLAEAEHQEDEPAALEAIRAAIEEEVERQGAS